MATIRKRGKSWRAEVCVHGRRDGKTCDTQDEAKAWAARIETEMRDGKYIDAKAAKNTTLADLLTRFGEEVTPTRQTKRSVQAEREKIDWLLRQPIAKFPISTITRDDVQAFIIERQKTVKAATIRRQILLLSSVVSTAIDTWKIGLQQNVFARPKIKPKKGEKKNRDRILSADEKLALELALKGCKNSLMISAFQIAIETGLRKAELIALEWSDINLEYRTMNVCKVDDLKSETVDGTKNGDSKEMPLSLAARDIFKSLPRNGERVFHGLSYHALDMAWARARERSGVVNITWHDLRHLAITTVCKQVKGDIFKLKVFSRHKSTAMLERYINLKAGDLLADMDR
jgi:integrase